MLVFFVRDLSPLVILLTRCIFRLGTAHGRAVNRCGQSLLFFLDASHRLTFSRDDGKRKTRLPRRSTPKAIREIHSGGGVL